MLSALDYVKIIFFCFTCLLSFTIIYKQGLQGTPRNDFMKLELRLSMLNGAPSNFRKGLKKFLDFHELITSKNHENFFRRFSETLG